MASVSPTKDNLNKNLHPEWIHSQKTPGSKKLFHIEGYQAMAIANQVFGSDGWKKEIKNTVEDFCEVANDGRVMVAMAATVRITLLKTGAFHEDTGYGTGDHASCYQIASKKARWVAGMDGMKRALRKFGKVLGNCLYDSAYLQYADPLVNLPPPTKQQWKPALQQQKSSASVTGGNSPRQQPASVTVQHLGKRSLPTQQQPTTTTFIKREKDEPWTKLPRHTMTIKKEPIATINKPPPPPLTPLTKPDSATTTSTSTAPPPPPPTTTTKENEKDNKHSDLVAEDSISLDEQDKAWFLQLTDAQLDINSLQRTCRENNYPPSANASSKPWSNMNRSP